jgi:hypothetical protein
VFEVSFRSYGALGPFLHGVAMNSAPTELDAFGCGSVTLCNLWIY